MTKVLFVDDELDLELLVKQKFRKDIADGTFSLYFAHTGQEALDLISKEPDIAVIISDVNMPEMDGLALLEKLKESHPAIKTIVVSAYGDTKTLDTAKKKGAYDYVTKPLDYAELRRVILSSIEA